MIEIVDLFKTYDNQVQAVRGVSFVVPKNQTLALVGESGCGKSTIGKLILGLEKMDSGKILFNSTDMSQWNQKQIASKIQMVFQDPASSLNPRQKVRAIISEPLLAAGGFSKEQIRNKVLEVAKQVGLSEQMLDRYPHTFSGGQKQRIGIARALITEPEVLICDEPVSALDVSIQAQILNLLLDIQKKRSLSILFISHDLSVVRFIANQVAVMYLGKIVEVAEKKELYKKSAHPYTRLLMQSSPVIGVDPVEMNLVASELPSSVNPSSLCSFRSRCTFATEVCSEKNPALEQSSPTHSTACFNSAKLDSPKV